VSTSRTKREECDGTTGGRRSIRAMAPMIRKGKERQGLAIAVGV
jgi:hypothetical protein